MKKIKMSSNTTIEIDKETHLLIRQYCIVNGITTKDFIRNLANNRLKEFKQRMEGMKKFNI